MTCDYSKDLSPRFQIIAVAALSVSVRILSTSLARYSNRICPAKSGKLKHSRIRTKFKILSRKRPSVTRNNCRDFSIYFICRFAPLISSQRRQSLQELVSEGVPDPPPPAPFRLFSPSISLVYIEGNWLHFEKLLLVGRLLSLPLSPLSLTLSLCSRVFLCVRVLLIICLSSASQDEFLAGAVRSCAGTPTSYIGPVLLVVSLSFVFKEVVCFVSVQFAGSDEEHVPRRDAAEDERDGLQLRGHERDGNRSSDDAECYEHDEEQSRNVSA